MHDEAPAAEYAPVAQLLQLLLPVLSEYLPAAHEVHEYAPVMAEYVDGRQVEHAPPDPAFSW